jgi:hypothetical protein
MVDVGTINQARPFRAEIFALTGRPRKTVPFPCDRVPLDKLVAAELTVVAMVH